MSKARWIFVIPAALALWAVLSEKVSLLLLAIVVYFAAVWYLRRGPIGKLASVPAEPAATPPASGNLPSNGRGDPPVGSFPGEAVKNGSC